MWRRQDRASSLVAVAVLRLGWFGWFPFCGLHPQLRAVTAPRFSIRAVLLSSLVVAVRTVLRSLFSGLRSQSRSDDRA